MNEDHPQCNGPRKAIKACQDKGQGALLLREWLCGPFSSTGLGSPCEFVSSWLQHTDPAGRDPHQNTMCIVNQCSLNYKLLTGN